LLPPPDASTDADADENFDRAFATFVIALSTGLAESPVFLIYGSAEIASKLQACRKALASLASCVLRRQHTLHSIALSRSQIAASRIAIQCGLAHFLDSMH
jgi:hypothetical protein